MMRSRGESMHRKQCNRSTPSLAAILIFGVLARISPALSSERAAPIVVRFENSGQVCASEAQKKAFENALTAAKIPPNAAITLIAYSDAREMKNPDWKERSDCAPPLVPDKLVGHERIAALRALDLAGIAKAAGYSSFGRPPFFMKQAADDFFSCETYNVILYDRLMRQGEEYRRVEIHWSVCGSGDACPPAAAPPTAGEYARCVVCPPQQLSLPPEFFQRLKDPEQGERNPPPAGGSWRRPAGWTTLAAGLAAIALGGGFFAAGGVEQGRASETLDPVKSLAYDAQSQDYWRAGGWAAGIGVSLTAGAIYLLASSRPDRPNQPEAHRQ